MAQQDFKSYALEDYCKMHGASGRARIQPCMAEDGNRFTALAMLQPGQYVKDEKGAFILDRNGNKQQAWLLISWAKEMPEEKRSLNYVQNHLDSLYVTDTQTSYGNNRAVIFEGAETVDLF